MIKVQILNGPFPEPHGTDHNCKTVTTVVPSCTFPLDFGTEITSRSNLEHKWNKVQFEVVT